MIFVILVYPKIMLWACQRRFSFLFLGVYQFTDVVLIRDGVFVNYFDQACAIWKACCIMCRRNVEGRCILVSELGFGFYA